MKTQRLLFAGQTSKLLSLYHKICWTFTLN